VEVDREDLVPLLLRNHVRRATETDACVRHEEIAVALPRDRRVDEVEHFLLLRDVRPHDERLAAERFDLGPHVPRALLVDVGDDDVGSLACELEGART
jgi:hypothetical protein